MFRAAICRQASSPLDCWAPLTVGFLRDLYLVPEALAGEFEDGAVSLWAADARFALALGAVANGLVESDPLLALSLAAESVARAGSAAPGFDARASMIAARQTLSGRGTFSATCRCSRGSCARNTTPYPPWPSGRTTSNRPIVRGHSS
mgnify:CR=1 FL=1